MVWWKDLWNWLKGPADADDARSTIEDPGAVTARPATWKDAFHLLALLEKHGAECVLLGAAIAA